jgi:hypothetical protein
MNATAFGGTMARVPSNSGHARGLRITTNCTSVAQFVASSHMFCEGTTIFIPNAWRLVGTETAFCFDLVDGTVVLEGVGDVHEAFTTNDNRYRRLGIVVDVTQWTPESVGVFQQLITAHERDVHAVPDELYECKVAVIGPRTSPEPAVESFDHSVVTVRELPPSAMSRPPVAPHSRDDANEFTTEAATVTTPPPLERVHKTAQLAAASLPSFHAPRRATPPRGLPARKPSDVMSIVTTLVGDRDFVEHTQPDATPSDNGEPADGATEVSEPER